MAMPEAGSGFATIYPPVVPQLSDKKKRPPKRPPMQGGQRVLGIRCSYSGFWDRGGKNESRSCQPRLQII